MQLIQGYKEIIPNFEAFMSRLAPAVQQKLRNTYAL
jgi:hypothetical protein